MEEDIQKEDGAIEVTTNVAKIEPLDTGVMVVGHPRSGTSASCQLLNSTDETEWLLNTQSDERNPYGYYEHKEFLSLSAQMMSSDPGEWHAQELGNIMNNLRHMKGIPGVKVLHVPSWYYWRTMIEEEKTFCIFRRPDLCRKSVYRQRLFAWGLDWQQQSNIMISIFEEAEDIVLTSFRRLLSKPEQVADKIDEQLDLSVDHSVIDPEQKSWRDTDVIAGELEWIAYNKLKKLESEQFGDEVTWDDKEIPYNIRRNRP